MVDWRNESPALKMMRDEFEKQIKTRGTPVALLTRHRLRGTYHNSRIAALWNQHLRTIKWILSLPAEDVVIIIKESEE